MVPTAVDTIRELWLSTGDAEGFDVRQKFAALDLLDRVSMGECVCVCVCVRTYVRVRACVT